jgi:hypothetical protein
MEDGSGLYCLACRRELAAEAGVDGAAASTTVKERAQLKAWALAEFEVMRDASRSNGEIARAIHSSVPAVQKARQRLGVA